MNQPRHHGPPVGYSRNNKVSNSQMLYGVVTARANNADLNVFVVNVKELKFLITRGSRIYSGEMAQLGDLVEFQAKPAVNLKPGSDLDGIVEDYQVVSPLPGNFKTQVIQLKNGHPAVQASCELTYSHRSKLGHGCNVFTNELIGEVLDAHHEIPTPRVNEPYRCCVIREHKFDHHPRGAWLVDFVQYQPVASLNAPLIGFIFECPSSHNVFIWCRKVKKLFDVPRNPMSAFGFENIGSWVQFFTTRNEEVARLALWKDSATRTKVVDPGKYMTSLSCEFRGEMRNGYAVWHSTLTGNVFDKLHITQPIGGNRGVFWCFLDLHDSGNEEWVIESVKEVERVEEQEMERVHNYERDEERRYERVHDHPRRQRNERVDEEKRVSRNESRQRNDRGEEMDRVSRNERIESRQSHGRVEDVARRQRKRSERVEERDHREEREHRHEDHSINGINGNMRRMSIGSAHSLPMTPRSVQASLPHDNSFDDQEGGSSLADICHQLFRLNSVRQVALKSDPILYAQLMERLNGFGSGRND